ncbi:MAG: M56 family metallopeptidase, partial [Acidobacteriota bacterium]
MTASGSGGAWSEMTWVGDTSSDPLWVDGGVFVARLIATHWLVGAALVFGVALVLRMLHLRLNASTRHAVWWSVLYLLAVLPLVGVGFSWLATDAEISAGPRDSVWSALVGDRQAAVVPTDPATAADGKAGARSISASGATGSASAHSRALAAMRLALAAVGLALAVFWGLLAAVRFSRLAAAGVAARALRAASRPAPARVRLLARELAASVSGAVCDIRTSNAVAGPACLGVRRPWIAVPDGWSAELSDEAVRHALLHEMGHAAR